MNVTRLLRGQWDRVTAAVAAGIGLLALLLGWVGVSQNPLPSQQLPYLASGAVLGVWALGLASTLWLSADLRDEWRKLDDLQTSLESIESLMDAQGIDRPRMTAISDADEESESVASGSENGSSSNGAKSRRTRPLRTT